jgi:hypothetical protein
VGLVWKFDNLLVRSIIVRHVGHSALYNIDPLAFRHVVIWHVEIRHCDILHLCIRHVGIWHRHVEPFWDFQVMPYYYAPITMQYLLYHNLYLALSLPKPINNQAEKEASLFRLTQDVCICTNPTICNVTHWSPFVMIILFAILNTFVKAMNGPLFFNRFRIFKILWIIHT